VLVFAPIVAVNGVSAYLRTVHPLEEECFSPFSAAILLVRIAQPLTTNITSKATTNNGSSVHLVILSSEAGYGKKEAAVEALDDPRDAATESF